ncbi:MAG: hypothetical protein LHV68_00525 [Elusimicrobia bacterium]|nr:hypothetical protein [Candidatus Liberimonas magnetica]
MSYKLEMKNRANFTIIILICCFFVNVFIPKGIFTGDMTDTLSQAIKCQSSVLYYSSISTLTLNILNKLIASELGLPTHKTDPSKPQNQHKEKKNSASDYSLITAQNNLMTKTTFSKFINPIYSISNTVGIVREFIFFQGLGFWLYIHCILLICFFFLLPRGSIDNYNILRPRC